MARSTARRFGFSRLPVRPGILSVGGCSEVDTRGPLPAASRADVDAVRLAQRRGHQLVESLAVPNFWIFLRGTPMLPWAWRLLGAHLGRGIYLDTTDLTEFDCVTIGDEPN